MSNAAGGAEKAASCAVNSFVPGTLVAMANGTRQAIENIKLGDKVLATDPHTGKQTAEPVIRTITGHGPKDLVTVTTTDAQGVSGTVVATAGHPFWLPKTAEWVDAGHLQPGMWLQTTSGTWVLVSAVAHDHREQTVHNLTIDTVHTYSVYAGDHAVLTHNCGQPRNALGQFTSGAGGESEAAAAGRTAHASYENTLGDADYVMNRRMPGSNDRPDAVNYAQNIVRELKPDNPRAVARGWRQVNRYRAYLEEQTGQPWTAYVDVYRP